jgi:hypothetical protein
MPELDTERRQTNPTTTVSEFVNERYRESSVRGTEWVADRNRAAIDVDDLRVVPQFVPAVDSLAGKGFVQLEGRIRGYCNLPVPASR